MNKFTLVLAFCFAYSLSAQQIPSFEKNPPSAPTSRSDAPCEPGQQEKTAPPLDPTQLQGPPDISPPTVTCLNGLNVNIMPTGMIQLWASDFILSLMDDITPNAQIKIGVRACGTGIGFPLDNNGLPVIVMDFDCQDLGAQCVEIWAMDVAGNADYCQANILIKDGFSACSNIFPYNVQVCQIFSACDSLSGIDEIQFNITVETPPDPPYQYVTSGYCIKESFPVGSNVTITPVKDDNHLNGVTTYDRVLIDKHITGEQPFTRSWQWLAADVNRDGLINEEDLTQIYDLIIGIYFEFPKSTSWRFVLKGHEFPSPDPLSVPYPESFHIQNLKSDTVYSASFWGVKVGDVNCTAIANVADPDLGERSQRLAATSIGLPRPNPTQGASAIPVHLPHPENLWLELYDLSGKRLWFNDLFLGSGDHLLEIPAVALSAPGMFVWRVRAGDVVGVGKLVRQ
jgi:hypothetical protein